MSQLPADSSSFPNNQPPDPANARPLPRRALPRCNLILHYRPPQELMFVVRTLMTLMRLGRAEATHKMWESYHGGRSVLSTTYLERAELYVELFAEQGLSVSIEPQ
jgi:ATP-dependent Clp protease adapter protein ClpS